MHREDFVILANDLVYFDNAATSLKPKTVIAKMDEYYNSYGVNIKRGDYDLSFKADNEYENVRSLVKDFIKAANTNEIVFTSGVTESLNLIVNGYFKDKLKVNDEILLTKSEHASNILPWFRLSKEKDLNINYIPLDNNYEVTLDNVKKAITPNTKVISIAHVTNVIGDVRPLKEIVKYAHSLGILVVVDAAQSIPHMAVDVQDLNVDFLVFSAHKMCGPTGVGVLYGKEILLEEVSPLNLGGGLNESFTSDGKYTLKSLPYRLEAGTPNIAGVIGLGAAIKYLNNVGIDKINDYVSSLKTYLVNRLSSIPYVKLVNSNGSSGIIAFNIEGIFSQDVAFYLNKYHICVRAGNHCAKILKDEIGIANTVRISLYFYNTKEEIDYFVSLISDKNKILKEMLP